MSRLMKSIVAILLAVLMIMSASTGIIATAAEEIRSAAEIEDTNMSLDGAKSNVQEYFSNEEWEVAYPEGLFIVEYSSYEVAEGGADPENPEDVYLGIVVYRIGGNNLSSTLSYTLSCVSGDREMYPDSMGSIEFMPQSRTATAKIRIKNDDKRNGDQLLLFALGEASTGVVSSTYTAAIKIFDDEPYADSVISVYANEAVTDKGNGGVKLTVKRTENSTDYCSFCLSAKDGSAVNGVDYTAIHKEIVFMNGQTEQEVVIPLVQSDEKYTDPRSFTVVMSDFKGCTVSGEKELRIDITNKLENEAKKITPVDGHSADLDISEEEALIDSSVSVVNVNDNLDRADLLRTVIGTANGTAVHKGSVELLANSENGNSSSVYWSESVVLPNTSFEQRYHTGNDWTPGKSYTDGNEDLMVSSIESFNLNYFDYAAYEFRNEEYRDISGNPNTAFGYLTTGGASDTDVKFYFIKSDLQNPTDESINWMWSHDMFFLKNWNNTNFNNLGKPTAVSFENTEGERHPAAGGIDAKNHKVYYIAYDDEGWDDTHFELGTTTLKRTVIPFNVFDTESQGFITEFEVVIDGTNKDLSYVSFVKDNYRWKISVDPQKGGGVGAVPGSNSDYADKDAYGFYVGSNLTVAFQPVSSVGGIATAVPQYLYMNDADGHVHNTSKIGTDADSHFSIPFETILSTNISTLQENHYMSAAEARDHVNYTLDGDECINSTFDSKIYFEATYALKQRIVLNFKNIPTLFAPKTFSNATTESEYEHAERVYSALKGVITFNDEDGKVFYPTYEIDLDEGKLTYTASDFKSILVSPESVGNGVRASSNLYDLDYQDFASSENISVETCTQISSDVVFTLYSENTSYLIPSITMKQTTVSRYGGSEFANEYVANALDEYVPFEALYSDLNNPPEISYYAVRFVISDIYVGKIKGDVKEFNVNIFYDKTKSTEPKKLLSFNFMGGASFAEASKTEFTYINSSYFKTNSDAGKKEFMPHIQLLDYSTNGYEYILYIPTYYNRIDPTDGEDQYYYTLFKGADGISIEMNDYKKSTDAEANEESSSQAIIASVDIMDTQYIAEPLPQVNTDSEGGAAQNHYFEEQEQFYTYNDHVGVLMAFDFTADWTGLPLAVSNIIKHQGGNKAAAEAVSLFGGSGAYVTVGKGEITAGVKISLNMGQDFEDQGKTDLGQVNGQNIVGGNAVSSQNSWRDIANSKSIALTGTVALDTKIYFTYNTLTHRYDLTKFMITLLGKGGVSVNVPLACAANLVFVTFTTTIGISVSGTGKNVLDYIDMDGKEHYATTFGGITLTPEMSVSGGVGAGISGLLSIESGVTFDASFSLSIGNETYVPKQMEYDIDNVNPPKGLYTYEFDGAWKTYASGLQTEGIDSLLIDDYYSYCYGETMCRTDQIGDKLIINGVGTSFHLVGSKESRGGVMRVTIVNDKGEYLMEPTDYDMYSEDTILYSTVVRWRKDNYTSASTPNENFSVIIEHVPSEKVKEGARISLDSIRIFNEDYSSENSKTLPTVITSSNIHLAMYVKFSIIGLSIKLEPAYMLIKNQDTSNIEGGVNKTSITLGTIGYSHTWDYIISSASDIPVLFAAPMRGATLSDPDYFNTGEFAESKTKTLLKADIDNTAKTQVISYNGDEYAFYTVLDSQESSGEAYYQLYYSKNDSEGVLVANNVFVADFNAYIDGEGSLAVQMTASDSTVASVLRDDDGSATMILGDGTEYDLTDTDKLSEALKRTCIKVCVFDSEKDAFDVPYVIEGTDGDGLQESLPVAVSTAQIKAGAETEKTVLFFVEDTETSVPAENDLNWTAYNNETAGTDAVVNGIMNSMYTGKATLAYSVKTADGYTEKKTVSLDEAFSEWEKPGFKITDIDAMMADDNTVCVAYSVELPYASLEGRKGVQKEIHYRSAVIEEDNTLTFGDTVVVDALFEYNDDLLDVYGETSKIPERYKDEDTGNLYESITLAKVQFENAAMYENGDSAQSSKCTPCLFYRTNNGINYVDYNSLKAADTSGSEAVESVKVLYDGTFDDYIIVADTKGCIYLIYNDVTESGSYVDTLYIVDYNSEDKIWNNPRRLTYSDVFSEEAYENREPTASVIFDSFSAYIDGNDKVSIALRSSYVPFSYEYGTNESMLSTEYDVDISEYYDYTAIDQNGDVHQYITVPILDFDSDYARTDIYKITFEERVNSVEVSNFTLWNEIFVRGEEIPVSFDINNAGDYMIEDMKVSLYYYHLANSSRETLVTKTLSGVLLAGDSYTADLTYTVDERYISDNTVLCVEITDSSGRRVLYDSYENSYKPNTDSDNGNNKEKTYHIINNLCELYFDGINVKLDSEGIFTYKICISNMGTADVKNDIEIFCNAYSYNEITADYDLVGTMFSMSVPADKLTSGSYTTIFDRFNAEDYFNKETGELYYTFEIVSSDPQYNTENDLHHVSITRQIPEIKIEVVSHEDVADSPLGRRSIGYLKLGDVIEIDRRIISSYLDDISIRAYEIGTNCLSIDNTTDKDKIRVKVVELPENNDGYVKILFNVTGTVIYRYLYLHISNTEMIDLRDTHADENWALTREDFVYAVNFDMLYTETDNSSLEFNFVGKNLKIYGDLLENGGDFLITLTDSEGNTVVEETVSTAKKYNDPGMLVYNSKELEEGNYKVKITSDLSEGERIALDYARFEIDTSDADTTPFATVEATDERLDAPMFSGRVRTAEYTVKFTKDIQLVEGKMLQDITLAFDEYEYVNGELKATGNKVNFVASEIRDGKILVFTSGLASKQGSVMKYILADSDIPAGMLTDKKGRDVKTAIPNYSSVSYELKESGILSVVVADDEKMPDGSVQKAVNVKFMTAPDVNRLKGTKLLYLTEDKNNNKQTVEFVFRELTSDPRTAIYRAEKLELDDSEMSKIFAFSEGIILGEGNYVLVTADGDYLENDVTTVIGAKSDLDIVYNRAKAVNAPLFSVAKTDTGYVPTLTVEFDRTVEGDADAYVTVLEKITDKNGDTAERELTLRYSEMNAENTAVVFKAEEEIMYGESVTAEYSLFSDSICYADEGRIMSASDKIAVDPTLEGAYMTFGTDGYIELCELYFNGENNLCAKVIFSTAVSEASLVNTSVDVNEKTDEYGQEKNRVVTLTFDRSEKENNKTVAYFSFDEAVALGYGERAKSYTAANRITVEEGGAILLENGSTASDSFLDTKGVELSRSEAASAEIKLSENANGGYDVELYVNYESEITADSLTNVVAVITVETANGRHGIKMNLDSVDSKTVKFVSETPIALTSGEIVSFTLPERFSDIESSLKDASGIAVSEAIGGLATLVADMSGKGMAKYSLIRVEKTGKNSIKVTAKITYEEALREFSFEKAYVELYQYIVHCDEKITNTVSNLEFEAIADKYTVVFSKEIEVPSSAESIRFDIGDKIINTTGTAFYNEGKTLELDDSVPGAESVTVGKAKAAVTAIISTYAEGRIEKLSDITVGVTYAENISVESISDITLTAKADGISGAEAVRFRATEIYNGTTILFKAENTDATLANLVNISIEDAALELNGATVYSDSDGFALSIAVPDAFASFVLDAEDTTAPDDTTKVPDDTTKAPDETTEKGTADSSNNNSETAATENSESDRAEETTSPDAFENGDDTPDTGDRLFIIMTVLAISLISVAAVVIVMRKKKG